MDVHPTCFVQKHWGVLSKSLSWWGHKRQCGAVARPFPMSSSKHGKNSFGNLRRKNGGCKRVWLKGKGCKMVPGPGRSGGAWPFWRPVVEPGLWFCRRTPEKQSLKIETFQRLGVFCCVHSARWTSDMRSDPSTGANIYHQAFETRPESQLEAPRHLLEPLLRQPKKWPGKAVPERSRTNYSFRC